MKLRGPVTIILIILGFAAFMAACAGIMLMIPTYFVVDTQPVPGDASKFDPSASYAAVAAYAGPGARLTDFEARYVRSDGTLDLYAAYDPSVEWTFEVPAAAPDDRPVGAGGGVAWTSRVKITASHPGQTFHTKTMSGSSSSEYSWVNRGMYKDVDDPSQSTSTFPPPPACSLATLWSAAQRAGTPASAVATVGYDDGGWRFDVSDIGVHLRFGTDCRPVGEAPVASPAPAEPEPEAPPRAERGGRDGRPERDGRPRGRRGR